MMVEEGTTQVLLFKHSNNKKPSITLSGLNSNLWLVLPDWTVQH